MKRILILLLTGIMAAAMLTSPVCAATAAKPWAEVDGIGTASQTISLRGVSGSCNGVQLTLKLDRAPGRFQFDTSLSGTDAHAFYTQDGNSLTLYAVSKEGVNRGDTITLGTLSGDQNFAVVSVTGVKLVTLDPDDPQEISYDSVSVSEVSGPSAGHMPFADVKEGAWYYEAVSYVYGHSLMNGTSSTMFSPSMTTTRSMLVTILYRYEGSPAVGTSSFPDVKPGMFYTDAAAWAAANGVVNGYSDGRFAPDDTVTREQMAAILYRYAQYKGWNVDGRADLSAYTDSGRISPYAREAMAWANHVGLITGVGGNMLAPRGSATRAEAATILMRFCKNVAR